MDFASLKAKRFHIKIEPMLRKFFHSVPNPVIFSMKIRRAFSIGRIYNHLRSVSSKRYSIVGDSNKIETLCKHLCKPIEGSKFFLCKVNGARKQASDFTLFIFNKWIRFRPIFA